MKTKNLPTLQSLNTMVCRIFETFEELHYYSFCIGKHIPQWNTRIQVNISNTNRKNMKHFGKDKNGKWILLFI